MRGDLTARLVWLPMICLLACSSGNGNGNGSDGGGSTDVNEDAAADRETGDSGPDQLDAEETGEDAVTDAQPDQTDVGDVVDEPPVADVTDQGPDSDDGAEDVPIGPCVDLDGDGRGVGCAEPDNCDDDPNNWSLTGCSACEDLDDDDWFDSCDRYVTVIGPDCAADDPELWSWSFEDLDGDLAGTGTSECTAGAAHLGRAPIDGDCADDDPRRSPLFMEIFEDGIDNDCDGNDATLDEMNVIYVDGEDGADSAAGTADDPVATVAAGIALAETAMVPTGVVVAVGTYEEDVSTTVPLFGGFGHSSGTWNRYEQTETLRTVLRSITLDAPAFHDLVVDNFHFQVSTQNPAVRLEDTDHDQCQHLMVSNNRVELAPQDDPGALTGIELDNNECSFTSIVGNRVETVGTPGFWHGADALVVYSAGWITIVVENTLNLAADSSFTGFDIQNGVEVSMVGNLVDLDGSHSWCVRWSSPEDEGHSYRALDNECLANGDTMSGLAADVPFALVEENLIQISGDDPAHDSTGIELAGDGVIRGNWLSTSGEAGINLAGSAVGGIERVDVINNAIHSPEGYSLFVRWIDRAFVVNNSMSGEGEAVRFWALSAGATNEITFINNNMHYGGAFGACVNTQSDTHSRYFNNNCDGEVFLDVGGESVDNEADVNDCGWDSCEDADGNTMGPSGFAFGTDRWYALPASSPLIDAGVDPPTLLPSAPEVPIEIDGDTRPNDGDAEAGAQHDIGADEYTP